MKRLDTLIYLLLITTLSFSQNIKRGYKQLEKMDYAKARDLFTEEYNSNNESPAANFGLTVILADDKSPFYNLIDAWSHAVLVEKNMNKLTEDDKAVVAEYFTNTEVRRSNWPVNKKMMQAIGAIEAKLIKYIREENNLDIANAVIEKFPDFRYYNNVIHIRNQLEFRKYEKQNTLDGYLEFMKKYPDAAQIQKAVKYRDVLAFENAKRINTVEAFEHYMKNYPGANNYGDAVKLRNAAAFRLARQKNTIESLEYFISKYPDALEIGEAKMIQQQLLYEYAKRIQTLEAYDAFIAKYPDGSHYIDIFNLKSLDLGMKFFNSSGLGWNNVLWTRSFDNNKFNESAGGLSITASNGYIMGCNTTQSDSLFRDAWILKLDNNGKMIWNKVLGGRYGDSIFVVKLNNDQDIIALGYTWLTPDSASREAWIFKLDSEGKKIWNRSLGKLDIKDILIGSNNDIFLGGYRTNDSLENHYSIMVINNLGRKLWERNYTSAGEINSLINGSDDNIVAGGTSWFFKMNPKGYLLWDSPGGQFGDIRAMQILSDGSLILVGFKDSLYISLIKVDNSGKKLWEKNYENPGYIEITSLQVLNNNNFMAIAETGFQQELLNFKNDGSELTRLHIPEDIVIHCIEMDSSRNLIFQITEQGNVALIKNSGTGL